MIDVAACEGDLKEALRFIWGTRNTQLEKSSCCKNIEKLVLVSNGNGFCRYQKVVKI
jgi:hypothetical protein